MTTKRETTIQKNIWKTEASRVSYKTEETVSYKITKSFQGGSSTFWAEMPINKKMRKGYWKEQLKDWGETTSGGHNYGYEINVKKQDQPAGDIVGVFEMVKFNPNYLEDFENNVCIKNKKRFKNTKRKLILVK